MTREEWLNLFIVEARPVFADFGVALPENVRASIGFPSKGIRSKTIGECWSQSASGDDHFEIFLRPSHESDAALAATLTHELVHAAVGLEAKHGPVFRKAAVALGLIGKMTATSGGPEWEKWALPVLEKIGPQPAAPMKEGVSSAKKTQTTRMIKLVCDECGWTCRTTKQHIEAANGLLRCAMHDCEGALAA